MSSDAAITPEQVDESSFAAALAPMTDLWRQLLLDHVPTSRGCCQACTQGGTGIPTVRWPCGPRAVAEAAAHRATRATNF